MNCPRCNNQLEFSKYLHTEMYLCNFCEGALIKKSTLLSNFAGDFIREIRNATFLKLPNSKTPFNITCPNCLKNMFSFPIYFQEHNHPLDFCYDCNFLWLDKNEIEFCRISSNKILDNNKFKKLEFENIKLMREIDKQRNLVSVDIPFWKRLLSLPIEEDIQHISKFPILIWCTALICILFSISSWFLNIDITQFGLIPSMPFRFYGITFITSFLQHGDIIHLFINSYFMILLGDNVENHIGKSKTFILLFSSALFADLMDILVRSNSKIPSLGASGGIAGLLIFYCLQFRENNLLIPYSNNRPYLKLYVKIKAPYFALIWISLQVVGLSINTNINYIAHISGDLIGFLAFYILNE